MHIGDQLHPVVEKIGLVADGVRDDDLRRPTPCELFDVRQLVSHMLGTVGALGRLGAGEEPDPADPWGNAGRPVTASWRADLRAVLVQVADAWQPEAAWDGSFFGDTIPRVVVGQMAVGEVVLHGWDLARATDQELVLDPAEAVTVRRIIEEVGDAARAQGAFGPQVPVSADSTHLHHALGGSGRDPGWT